MKLVSQDEEKSQKIAVALDNGSEELFRDFELSAFLDHFKLDALEQTLVALAVKEHCRSDLKMKGIYFGSRSRILHQLISINSSRLHNLN